MMTSRPTILLIAVAAILAATIGCPPPQSQPQPLPQPLPGSTAGPGVTAAPADVPETPIPEPPTAEEPKVDMPKAEVPKAEEPKAEEPKADMPKAEEPKVDMPKAEEPKAEAPKADQPKVEAPKPEQPKADAPKADAPKADMPKADEPKKDEPKTDAPKADQAAKAELFLKLPEGCNTPDGMCLLADGSVILSMPNFNKLEDGARLMKITADNKVEKFLELGKNPGTGELIGPLGVCLAPSGDLFLADYQMKGDRQSRVLRIPMKDGKPGEPVSVIEGFHVSNAVICHAGYLYVSETQIDTKAQPGISGIFRFKLDELEKGVVKLAEDETKDPHLVALIEFKSEELRLGADGLCFDKAGNLYCGNFTDGTLHRVELDDQGNVKSNKIFATADFMKSCDGLFFNPKTDEVYVTDSKANAIQVVTMDGKVRTLAQNGDTDGLDGGMDQPCEVLLRGNELIVSNMDWPVPGCINKAYNEPCTLSVIRIAD
ncbi:MAG: NHL repeat-containing protein [Thermoguttaceae bacterium]